MPKSREQNQIIKDERKEAIIRSATELFAFKSYKNITIDDIAKQTKCSHGLFYHYYSSKEELFHDIMNHSIKEISKVINISNSETNPDAKLSNIIQNFLDILKNQEDYLVYILYMLLNLRLQEGAIPKSKTKNANGEKPVNRHIYDLIIEGQKQNQFLEGNPKEYTICFYLL